MTAVGLGSSGDRINAESGAKQANWLWPVLVLSFCHAAAIASFQVLNVLVGPIKASIGLSDTQYSLMQGLAVAVFASLLGVPAAMAADHSGRRNVVIAGVAIWSAGTLACGFARTFGEFFTARMAVGLGEVFLFPAALSMIADVAPPRKLATAIGLFGCGGPVGAGLALVGGGWLVGHQADVAAATPTLFGEAWRSAFLICAAVGAIAAGLLCTVAEPRRHRRGRDGSSLRGTVRHLAGSRWTYLGVAGGMIALSFCVFATSAWAPTVLVRDHGMTYAGAGTVAGLGSLAGGVGGAWAAGLLTDRIAALGRRDAALLVAMGVAALIFVAVQAAVAWPYRAGAILFLVFAYALLGMPTVLAATALQQISPPGIRAKVMAIQVLLVNLFALSLGPWTVAVLTEKALGRPQAIGAALVWADAAGALVTVLALFASRRRFARAASELEVTPA